jgi:hypothetical protein
VTDELEHRRRFDRRQRIEGWIALGAAIAALIGVAVLLAGAS